MFHRIDTSQNGALDAFGAMGVGVCGFAGGMGLIYRSPHLIHRELRITDIGARREDAAACDELHIVGARLDLRSSRAAHRIRPVRLVTKLPPVPSGYTDDQTAQYKTRRRAQALLRGSAQGKINAAARAAIADGSYTALQAAPGITRRAQQSNGVRVGRLLGAWVG